MDTVDVVVVGAGVVGLAVGRRLALAGLDVVVVEAEDDIGTQTSSRNSEVIHAGIYYPRGSHMASACVRGRDMLYRYCEERGVAHRRIGKLIVATSSAQLPELARISVRARGNGVDDLQVLYESELHDLEPDVHGVAGLLSPSTGIVDAHSLMRSLRRDVEEAGGSVALCSRLTGGSVRQSPVVDVNDTTVACRWVINCAGLGAWDVARSLEGFPAEHVPPRHLAKGNYFRQASGTAPFGRLIYPIPVEGGLGIHLTLDLDGRARFGPDVEWIDDLDRHAAPYAVDPQRADRFVAEIRHYWPELADDALVPDYAGVRPKLSGPGEPSRDFLLQGPADHGVAGLINMFGIESPGLTSSLALADDVAAAVTSHPLR
ncbi:NAD(P)/FAD-dependent oxidoreductase [Gordonia sp. PKS22-38]|uniref:NAD(P)/FAD-dependent oxidoreductase n=1 Tax=Gordonia prachuapensis TaxID=3115651 RepID=A0ABU7MZW2_9ACTN|nr:NAD(P)/FAD-dependent oxidoreductase [Gordonia sp. PKS22-38]